MTQRYVIRFCTDTGPYLRDEDGKQTNIPNINEITPAFLTCLENAGLGKVHDTDRDGYTFDLFPPCQEHHGIDEKTWAEENAKRISSFGFNAVAAPRWGG